MNEKTNEWWLYLDVGVPELKHPGNRQLTIGYMIAFIHMVTIKGLSYDNLRVSAVSFFGTNTDEREFADFLIRKRRSLTCDKGVEMNILGYKHSHILGCPVTAISQFLENKLMFES